MKPINISIKTAAIIAIVGLLLAGHNAYANTTNTVPFNDSFETYGDGSTIVDTHGWYGATSTYAVVTNNGDYGYVATTYPLNASNHTKVVVLDTENGAISNVMNNTSTTDIWIDMMLDPTRWSDADLPDCSDPDIDFAMFVNSNGNPVVYHWKGPLVPANEQTNIFTVIPYVTIASDAWARVSIHESNLFSYACFDIRIDGGAPLTNAAAFTEGAANGGPLFLEANTNAKPRGVTSVSFSGTGFLDDFVVTDTPVEYAIMWAITASVNNLLGASTSPSGTFMVSDGVNTSVTITVSNFWEETDVAIDGSSAGTPLLVTLTNVTANHTVAVTVAEQVATNGTGISVPKWWLAQNVSGTATNDADTILDSDSDGFLNWEEWFTSTDPINSNSIFEIIEHYAENGTGYVVWVSKDIDPSLPPFRVLRRTDMKAGGWTVVDDNVARGLGTGGTNLWADASPPAGEAFYRVEATNAP